MKKKKPKEEWIKTGLYSFQITIPHSEYGECEWFIPRALRDWFKEHTLNYSYCGGGSWGNGYTNGITNRESVYIVRDAHESDGLAFKLQFPKCRIHISEQIELRV